MRGASSLTDMALRSLLTLLALLLLAGRAAAYDVIAVAVPGMADSLHAVVASPAAPAPERGWPSLYMLNGYEGSHLDWAKRVNIDSIAEARGLVMVFPDGGNSWYFDTPGCPMESGITGPLVATVDSLYHTSTLRAHRAIAGLSMGGHGAIRLAGRHPELFGTVASMSGAVSLAGNPLMRKRYGLRHLLGDFDANPAKWFAASAMAQVDALKRADTRIALFCGTSDPFINDNHQLVSALMDKDVLVEYHFAPGNHNWAYWRRTFPQLLDFVTRNAK